MAAFITVLVIYAIFIFVIPTVVSGKHGSNSRQGAEVMISILDNQFLILAFALGSSLIVVALINNLQDKFMVVSITIDNNNVIIKSRRPKLSSLREHSFDISSFKLNSDKVKLSPIESPYHCYRIYKDTDFIGYFIPEHFVWTDTPKRHVIETLKKLKPYIRDK